MMIFPIPLIRMIQLWHFGSQMGCRFFAKVTVSGSKSTPGKRFPDRTEKGVLKIKFYGLQMLHCSRRYLEHILSKFCASKGRNQDLG